MEQALVSVIVPCYNVEKYLHKCIDSILRQSYQNLEIWLVDDGSPDGSGMICDEYARKDDRIRVIHKENGGLSEARNVAIDQATGEWITFVDSDDYIADDYVETLYYLAQESGCQIAVGQFVEFVENSYPRKSGGVVQNEILEPYNAVELMFYQKIFDTSAWAKIYHNSLFKSGIRYPRGLIFEDLATTYRLMLKSNGVALTNKVIYYYLSRSSSIDREYNPKKFQSGLAVTSLMDAHRELLRPIENSYRCRKFCLYYHLLLPMPRDAEGREQMVYYIKNNRWRILKDSRARVKARLAALLSYFGYWAVRTFYRFV